MRGVRTFSKWHLGDRVTIWRKNPTVSLLNTAHEEGSEPFKDQSLKSQRKIVEIKLVELSAGKYLCDSRKLF